MVVACTDADLAGGASRCPASVERAGDRRAQRCRPRPVRTDLRAAARPGAVPRLARLRAERRRRRAGSCTRCGRHVRRRPSTGAADLAGRRPVAGVRALGAAEGVTVVGEVADAADVLRRGGRGGRAAPDRHGVAPEGARGDGRGQGGRWGRPSGSRASASDDATRGSGRRRRRGALRRRGRPAARRSGRGRSRRGCGGGPMWRPASAGMPSLPTSAAGLTEVLPTAAPPGAAGIGARLHPRSRRAARRTASPRSPTTSAPDDELVVVEAGGRAAAPAVAPRRTAGPPRGRAGTRQEPPAQPRPARPLATTSSCSPTTTAGSTPGGSTAMAAPFADPPSGVVFGDVRRPLGRARLDVPPLPAGRPPAVDLGVRQRRRDGRAPIGRPRRRRVRRAPRPRRAAARRGARPRAAPRWRRAGTARIAGGAAGAPPRVARRRGDRAQPARVLAGSGRVRRRRAASRPRGAPPGCWCSGRATRRRSGATASTEGGRFGPATSWAFARGLARGVLLKPRRFL